MKDEVRKNSIKKGMACLALAAVFAVVSFGGCGKKIDSEQALPEKTVPADSSALSEEQTSTPSPDAGMTENADSGVTPSLTESPDITTTPSPTESPDITTTPSPTEPPAVSELPEEGMLSKPDHPETVTNDKLIFIGDSRTEAIRDAVSDDSNSIWSCLSGKGYEWMASTGVPQIEGEIEDNTAVIILMGVNDIRQINNYVDYINKKANEWANVGATTYFVSVGPVENDPYVTNMEIESFNAAMEANLLGVKYIDVYSHLVSNGYSTIDGIHYPVDVSTEIYNYILDNLEETRSGIWG